MHLFEMWQRFNKSTLASQANIQKPLERTAVPWSGAVIAISVWFTISISMVFFNKALISNWHFHYPIFLTCWHLLFSALITQILARTTNLLPSLQDGKMTTKAYFTFVVPISICLAGGIVTGNAAYEFLSVAYIQMIKSINPVPLLLLYYAFGMEKYSFVQIVAVSLITMGVWISSVGELRFSWLGFMLQVAAVLCDIVRVLNTDWLLKIMSMDSLTLLYYTTPLAFLFMAVLFMFTEMSLFPWERVQGRLCEILVLNGIVAFLVNFTSVYAMQATSGLVLSIMGPIKDFSVILTSPLVFNSPVTVVQIMGFSVTLSGLAVYRIHKVWNSDMKDGARAWTIDTAKRLRCDWIAVGLFGVDGIVKNDQKETQELEVKKITAVVLTDTSAEKTIRSQVDDPAAADYTPEDKRQDVEM